MALPVDTKSTIFIFVILSLATVCETSRYASKYSADQSLNAYRDFNDLPVQKRAAMPIPRLPPLPGNGTPPVAATGTCSTWGQEHYNTFDGQIYTFPGYCEYILVADCLDFSFHIYVRNEAAGVCSGIAPCRRWVTIENGDPLSLLKLSPRDDGPLVTYKGIQLTLPTSIDGMIIEEVSSYILVKSGLGFSLVWDGFEYIDVHVTSTSLKGSTCGLCGKYNDNPMDDFSDPLGVVHDDPYTFGNSWQNTQTDECITDTTDTTYRYRYKLPEVLNDVTRFEFEVRAYGDVYISLSSSNSDVDPMYEIYIGANNDTKSGIRRCKQCPTLATALRSGGFVNMETFTKFWIKLDNGRISVGDEQSTYPFMFWSDANPLSIRYIGYSTSSNSIGVFRFCGISSTCVLAPPPPAVRCTEASYPPYFYDNPAYKHLIDQANFATESCNLLMSAPFDECHSVVDVNPYVYACEEDLCSCSISRDDCPCDTFSAYALECSRHDVVLSWRTNELCPLLCTNGTVYDSCGGSCPSTCENRQRDCVRDYCLDGCHCPEGQLWENGQCIDPNQCPCEYNNREYPSGHVLKQGCNTCKCSGGLWTDCTNNICGSKCWASGDPHYRTFDSKRYDFQGDCSYVLVQDCWDHYNDYSIQSENSPCRGPGITCTKSVTIKMGGSTVILQREFVSTFDGITIDSLPYGNDHLYVEMPSEAMIKVTLKNNIEVFWDGTKRVEISVPAEQYNKTCGLCGTYTNKQNDDFYTRAGDIETNAISFGNKWKVYGSCPDLPIDPVPHPCDLFSQRAPTAELQCRKLKDHDDFKECHQVVDPIPYYRDCLYDVCNCQQNGLCECDAFAQYSLDCANKGVVLEWRQQIDQCKIECSNENLVYWECGPSCFTSCASLSSNFNCTEQCVQGCSCPEGTVLDRDSTCVIPEACSCEMDGSVYKSGEVVPKGCGECTCLGGSFLCSDTSCPITCGVNEEVTNCVPECVKTCTNMHEFEDCTPAQCLEGCKCKDNYVWDGFECVLPSQCPCHHGGKSHQPNDIINMECNKLQCNGTAWIPLTAHDCPVTCVAWGDPHYETFDGKMYGFQGDCEYVLVTNYLYQHVQPDFQITAKNEPCGTSTVTCTKSVRLTIGSGQNQETIILDRYLPIESSSDMFRLTEVGLSVFVHTDIGVTLVWDKKTRIEVKLDPIHKNTVGGLCGTYNGNQEDDFTKSNGGFPVASATVFANSWKTSETCGNAPDFNDTCQEHPHRKPWAQRKCSIIKSDTFKECHSEVPYEEYYVNCLFDACGCDSGGDCECLCTAIAAYAQACNAHGVAIKWRSQELCPIQCDGCFTYDPCVSLCDTCDNRYYRDADGHCLDICVEGCKCPEGEYLQDGECVKTCPEPTTLVPTTSPTTTLTTTTIPTTNEEPTTQSLTTRVVTVTEFEPSTEGPTKEVITPSHSTKTKTPTPDLTTSEPSTTKVTTPESTTPVVTTTEPTTTVTTTKLTTKVTTTEPTTTVITTEPTTTVTTTEPTTTLTPTKCVTQPPKGILKLSFPECWSEWMNDENGSKVPDAALGEFELLDELRNDYQFCENPSAIECRVASEPYWPYYLTGQEVECNLETGLECYHSSDGFCYDYEIRVRCECQDQPFPLCSTTMSPTTMSPTTMSPTTTEVIDEHRTTVLQTFESPTAHQPSIEPTTTPHDTSEGQTKTESTTSVKTTTSSPTTPGETTVESTATVFVTDIETTESTTTVESTTAVEPTTSVLTTEPTTTTLPTKTIKTTTHPHDTTEEPTTTTESTTEPTTTTLTTTTRKTTTSPHDTTEEPTTKESTTSMKTTNSPTPPEETTAESTATVFVTDIFTTESPTIVDLTTAGEPTTTESTTEPTTTTISTTTIKTTTAPHDTTEEPTTTESTTEPTTTLPTTTIKTTTTPHDTTEEPTTTKSTTEPTTTTKTTTSPHDTTEEPTTTESTTEPTTTTKTTTSPHDTTEEPTTTESTTEPTTTTISTTTIKTTTAPHDTTEEPTTTESTTEPTTTLPTTTIKTTTPHDTTEEPTTTESTTEPTTTTKTTTSPHDTTEEPTTTESTTEPTTTTIPTTMKTTTPPHDTTEEPTTTESTTGVRTTTNSPTPPEETTAESTATVFVTDIETTESTTTVESTTAVEPTTSVSTSEPTTTTLPTTTMKTTTLPNVETEEPTTTESTTEPTTTTLPTTTSKKTTPPHDTTEEPTTTESTTGVRTTTNSPTPPEETTAESTATVFVTDIETTESTTTVESTTAVEPTTSVSTSEPTTTLPTTTMKTTTPPHVETEEPTTTESTTEPTTTTLPTTTSKKTTPPHDTTEEPTTESTTGVRTTTNSPTPPEETTAESTATVFVTDIETTESTTTVESTTAVEPTTSVSTSEPTTTTLPTTTMKTTTPPHVETEEPTTTESTTEPTTTTLPTTTSKKTTSPHDTTEEPTTTESTTGVRTTTNSPTPPEETTAESTATVFVTDI
ncbi:mucin-2-like [Anneissia japonica]|uniref:mucin-2-like n=1 Tax=Anneissia japonica TaxID=1529436 RepID=UPI0014254DE7|nr:mucin-2-like [Anneissia japonica]